MSVSSIIAFLAPGAGGDTPFAQGANAAQAGQNGEAFSHYLSQARQQISPNAQKQQLAAQVNATLGARAAALATDKADYTQALDVLRNALDHVQQGLEFAYEEGNFDGNSEAKEAAEDLIEYLETADNLEDINLSEVLEQLPSVQKLPKEDQANVLAKVRQFIQAALLGDAVQQAENRANIENKKQAQAARESAGGAVQLAFFHPAYVNISQISKEAQEGQTAQTIQEGQTAISRNDTAVLQAQSTSGNIAENGDDLPAWLRDADYILQGEEGEGNYSEPLLPEVDLPGDEAGEEIAASVAANNAALVAAKPDNGVDIASLDDVQEEQLALSGGFSKEQSAKLEQQQVASLEKQAARQDAKTQQANSATSFSDSLKADHAAQATGLAKQQERLAPLPNAADTARTQPVTQQVDASGVVLTNAQNELTTYNQHARHQAALHLHRDAVLEQVQVAITRARGVDSDRITIQLNPADLGRVEVSLDVRQDGTTQLNITADKRETLDLLQRDARSLERSLQDAGVKADAGSMEFNLRQGSQQAAFGGNGEGAYQGGQHQAQSQQQTDGHIVANEQTVLAPAEVITTAEYVVQHGLNVVA